VAITLIAALAIGTFSVLDDDTSSRSSVTSRSVNADAERWTAVADQYLDGARAVTTDAARWTAAARAYGALERPAVLGVTTPSELRGIGMSVGDEPEGSPSTSGNGPAGFHPLP
jgi:hypothetical protein